MISIKSFLRRGAKASSREPGDKAPALSSSLFNREPLDFDLISQLTHMSAAATAGISRDKLFEGTSRLDYSTSRFFRRVHLVAKRLNYDYSRACELVAETTEAESVQNLLLRLSTSLSAGEPEEEFLARETEVQLELYGKKYERDIESLRKWTDAYVALMVSCTLIVVISMVSMMIYSMGSGIIVGMAFIVLLVTIAGSWVIFSVAPHEVKTHHLARKSPEQYQMKRLAQILLPVAAVFGAVLGITFGLGPALIGAAVVLAPLGYVAFRDDRKVDSRDQDIATFLRALGGVMGAVGTTVGEGLNRLNRRSLGSLEPHVRRLYVRLGNNISPQLCWLRFAGETGSELVTRSVRTFWDGLRLGGDASRVGTLSSTFAQKVALQRSTRKMVSSTFAFVVVPLHVVLLSIMLFITEVMRIFGGELAKVQDQSLNSDIMSEAGVNNIILYSAPNMRFITVFVGIMIVVLTAANSFAPYAAGGGNRYKLCLFAAVMMFMSGLAIMVVPAMVSMVFHNIAATPTMAPTQ
jgi:flagellar protein FlaJ